MERSDGSPSAAASRAGTAATLLIAGVVCLTMPLPWQLAAIGFGLAAIALGIAALVGMRDIGVGGRSRASRAPLLLAMFAIAGGGLLTTVEAAVAVTYPLQREMQSCLAGANTRGARDTCLERYESTIDAWQDAVR